MKLELNKIDEKEYSQAFDLFCVYMKPVIEDAFGWVEAFQVNDFKQNLYSQWFYWIEVDNEKVGLICYNMQDQLLRIHLLIVFTQFQRKGFGKLVIEQLITLAKQRGVQLTLSSFKNNKSALAFYKKLNFSCVSEDRYSINLSCEALRS